MIQKIKNSLKKRKVKVFLVFLFCSTSAWFISNLSETYISNATFDLDYKNTSEDLMLVNYSQDKIDVKLEAGGFQFLGFNFKNKDIIVNLSEVVKEGRQYYLPFPKFRAQVEKQLPSSIRLIEFQRDTLFFDFQEVMQKEVPVKPQIQLQLAQNYLLEGKMIVEPPTVSINGPRNEVDTIKGVKTSEIIAINITSDFSRKAYINIPEGLRHTTFSTNSVTVSGKVSRFSEKLISVDIKAVNFPSGTSVKMFPDKVNILCKGTINALKNLNPSDFEVVADFAKVTNSKSKKIKLMLENKPESLSSAILQEAEIEYILRHEK